MARIGFIRGVVAFAMCVPSVAASDYVRDEIRVNLRTGPGPEYRILKGLSSGDRVRKLQVSDDWVRVRTPKGVEGWVPKGYLSKQPPASVALPEAQAKLSEAKTTIQDLQLKLENQGSAMSELTSLREQVDALSTENVRLEGATRWKDLLAGAGLVALGILLGAAVPRSGGARSRRIKL